MNASASSGGEDRISIIFYGAIGSLIAAALIAAGVWLVGRQVPDETVLQFSYSEDRVGDLASWYLRITNNTEVAFDVQFTPPSAALVRYEYAPRGDGSPTWKGQIPRGRWVEALFVYEGQRERLSSAGVQALIAATYQDRNPQTGVMETRIGKVREVGVQPFLRTALLVFWFVLPIAAFGAIFFLGPLAFKWLVQRFSH